MVTTTGKQLGMLAAVPLKRALRNDARKLSVEDALGELIDNSVDNFAKQQELGYTENMLAIRITIGAEEIVIDENSGGVGPDDLLAFVQVGNSGSYESESPTIGVWGSGQKMALAKLGRDITISTRYWNPQVDYELDGGRADQVVLRMDPSWWRNDSNWSVPVFEPEEELPRGRTFYRLLELNEEIDEAVVARVRASLQYLYGDLLAARPEITIKLNDDGLTATPHVSEEALREIFAFPPGYEPTRHYFDLAWTGPAADGTERKAQHTLKMEIIVGLTPRALKAEAGVYMLGIPTSGEDKELGPRMFARALQEEAVGYNEGSASLLRKNDPTLGRLRFYIVFRGRSEDIPWGLPGSPVKKGYNAANPVADKIREHIKEVAKPYVRFTTKAREIDVLPYSKEWQGYRPERKRDLVRRGLELPTLDDLDDPVVEKALAPILEGQYNPQPFQSWNHAQKAEPPVVMPAFVEGLSKQVASTLVGRDRRLKQLNGDDPREAVNTLLGTLSQSQEVVTKAATAVEEEGDGAIAVIEDKAQTVSVRLRSSVLRRLQAKTGKSSKTEAVMAAILAYLGEAAEDQAGGTDGQPPTDEAVVAADA